MKDDRRIFGRLQPVARTLACGLTGTEESRCAGQHGPCAAPPPSGCGPSSLLRKPRSSLELHSTVTREQGTKGVRTGFQAGKPTNSPSNFKQTWFHNIKGKKESKRSCVSDILYLEDVLRSYKEVRSTSLKIYCQKKRANYGSHDMSDQYN